MKTENKLDSEISKILERLSATYFFFSFLVLRRPRELNGSHPRKGCRESIPFCWVFNISHACEDVARTGWGWVVGAGPQPAGEGRVPAAMTEPDAPAPALWSWVS